MFAVIYLLGIITFALFIYAVSITAIAARDKKPIELPEWTGRERESLRADLEDARKKAYGKFMGGRSAVLSFEGASEECGLFPEALEAYMEQE